MFRREAGLIIRHRAIITFIISVGLVLTVAPSMPSSALTFKKGESIAFSKREESGSSSGASECDPDKGEAYLFDDPAEECVKPDYGNWKVIHKNSRKKNEKAFPAYYQLRKQAKALKLPKQYHLFEWHEAYHGNANFTHLPACKDRKGSARDLNPDLVPAYLPEKVVADTSVNYAGGRNNEIFDEVGHANLPIGMACQGGDAIACDRVVEILHEGARSDRLRFDDNLRWRHQTAYMVNNHLLLPTLNFYAFAIAKAPSWNETVHAEIGEWLARVVADSDEYMYYGFGYYEGPLWHEIKSITNHVTMQGAVRMAYGILWNDPERVVEGLNLYKYRLETVREDASMASETRRGSMALNYQNQGITDIVLIAEMAAAIGIDLYSYRNRRGQDIHDVAEFVIRTHIEDDLIRDYASARYAEGWFADMWPEFNRKRNWIGQKGTWYHLYKLRFPDSPVHRIVDRDETGKLYLYDYSVLSTLRHPTNAGANPLCLSQRPVAIEPVDAENEIVFSEPKRTWDVRLSNVEPRGDSVVGRAQIGTIIRQYLPVRKFDVHFQVEPGSGTGRFALFEGVSNDGDPDSSGNPFSFAMDDGIADRVRNQCGVDLYAADGASYPTFDLRDVMQTADRDRPVTGLSDQALCQMREYGRYGYVDMVNMLSLIARGLQGRVEDRIHADDPGAMKLLQGLQSRLN